MSTYRVSEGSGTETGGRGLHDRRQIPYTDRGVGGASSKNHFSAVDREARYDVVVLCQRNQWLACCYGLKSVSTDKTTQHRTYRELKGVVPRSAM